MQGEDQRQRLRNVFQHAEQGFENLRVIDVGRAVHGHDAIALGAGDRGRIESLIAQGVSRWSRNAAIAQQGVDHDITDKADALGGNAFVLQVRGSAAFRGVQTVGYLVGEHPVDFFRHASVVAAQAGLDMHDGDTLFDANQGAGEGRVHVANDQNARRFFLIDNRLEASHYFRRLYRMAARAHFQIDVRLGQTQILEEFVVHVPVVMLAGMQQQGGNRRGVAGEGAQDGRHFHEIGAGTHDTNDGSEIGRPGVRWGHFQCLIRLGCVSEAFFASGARWPC